MPVTLADGFQTVVQAVGARPDPRDAHLPGHSLIDIAQGYDAAKLLFDAMTGDQTLFHRMDIVEAGWEIVQPILDAWSHDTTSPLPTSPTAERR